MRAPRSCRPVLVLLAATVLVASGRPASADAEPPARAEQALGSQSIEERREAAAALSSLRDVDALSSALTESLAGLRRDGDAGRLELEAALLRAPADADPIDVLVGLEPSAATRDALAALCRMRALARLGTTPAVRELVERAFAAPGAPRIELGRDLRRLDERATAALIEARGRSPELRRWAQDEMDALGKRTPGDAVQTNDDQVLVDVLRAYADVHDTDAVPVVLSFVHSDRAPVREAARQATLAYGPDALPKVRSTYAALTGVRLADDVDPTEAARDLFDAYDRHRLRDVYAALDDGLQRQRAGDLDAAVARFDEVLAREPMLDRRAETAPAYLARGRALAAAHDFDDALASLHVALRVAPHGPEADRIHAAIASVEGDELLSHGIVDESLFERALTADPHDGHSQAVLDEIRRSLAARRARELRVAVAVGATGLALLATGAVALLRRRRRAIVRRLRLASLRPRAR